MKTNTLRIEASKGSKTAGKGKSGEKKGKANAAAKAALKGV